MTQHLPHRLLHHQLRLLLLQRLRQMPVQWRQLHVLLRVRLHVLRRLCQLLQAAAAGPAALHELQ
jgi:hypothetical protein